MPKKNTTEDKIKKIAREVTEKAEPYIADLKTKAEPVVKDIKSKAEPVVKDIKSKAEPVVKDIKSKAEPAYSNAKSKADPYIKDLKSKAEPVIKNAKKTAAKFTCKEETFIQYNDHEIRTKDIMDMAKDDYIKKGHEESDIKEIQLYIKPSEKAAYYVVNRADTGKLEL